MVTPSEFFETLRALRPQDELKPGVVFVAILHYDKLPDGPFDQPDALWIKCPREKDVSSLVNAYRRECPEAGDFVLRHNFQVLEEETKISALANRYPNDFVALEAVTVKDLNKRKYLTAARAPLTEIANGVNRSLVKAQTSSKFNNEAHTKESQPRPLEQPQVWSVRRPSKPEPACPPPSLRASPHALSMPDTLAPTEQTAWEDFLFERLEISRISSTLDSTSLPDTDEPSATDEAIKEEWLGLDQGQKSYFIERAGKIVSTLGFTSPEDRYAEHWGFWSFYCSECYATEPAIGGHRDRDFETRNRQIEDSLALWTTMKPNARKKWVADLRSHVSAAVKRGAISQPQCSSSPVQPNQASTPTTGIKSEQKSSPSPRHDENNIPQFDGPATGIDFQVELEDVPGPSTAASTRLSMAELFDGRTPEQLEKSVQEGVVLLGSIKRALQEQPSQDATQWLQTIENVQKQATRSKTVIGVVGATGAGKSSVINAMLDEERLVPTNCMRACTAVVTEISYNHEEGAPYRAEVEFISRDDWHKMLKILFQDLLDNSGQVSRECTDEDSESGIAYAQIKAVYPRMTKDDMENITIDRLIEHDNVACLGTTREIQSDDPTMFYKKLQRYVDSKEKTHGMKEKARKKDSKPREMEFWPLIRVVRLYVKAPALATGAVIVDLPGVHDSNQARAAVAQGYMKQCTGLWIVAPITRAVDDKSAKTLLGDTFKRQLKMDGGFDSVTFICSKTDDISITEAQDSLGLDEELTPMWEKWEELRKRKNHLQRQINDLKDTKLDITAAMETAEEDLELWEALQQDFNDGKTVFRPTSKSQKRKREDDTGPTKKKKRPNYQEPDSDDDFIDDGDSSSSDAGSDNGSSGTGEDASEPLQEDEIAMKIADLRGTRKEGRREKIRIDQELQKLEDQIKDIEKESEHIDGTLSAKCISGRNEYSRAAIRQDYAAGIRELDQEIAEEEDAANFDPEIDRRNYDEVARNLPVFCVSSRAYQKLRGRLQKDKSPPGFTHIDETEMPALQAHCIQLTTASRMTLLNSLRLWASNEGTGRSLTEGQVKREAQILKERLDKLDSALEKAVTAIVDGIEEELQDKVYDAYPTATGAAQSEANNTVQKWGSPVNRENLMAGGLYWSTYKAVVRRDGVFNNARASNNFNEQLTEPVIRHLAGPWESVFARRLPGILNSLPANAGQILTSFHDEVERRAIRNGASIASFQMLKHQIAVYKETLKDAINEARNLMSERQRNINREFEPRVREHMLPVYYTCTAETGPGQFARMKGYIDRHVEQEKLTMFNDAVEHVRELLDQMLKEMKSILLGKVDAVLTAIERDYTGVVVGQDQGQRHEMLPRDQRMMRRAVIEIIDSAELVFKRAVGLVPDPAEPDTQVQADAEVESKHEPIDAVKDEPEERGSLDLVPYALAVPQGDLSTASKSSTDTEVEAAATEIPP
ncbi:tat pathway signal sequence [Cladophialophora carrionii]|uniref:Tat pathway signal sequence n=1 Tax=Cladophialophora carrionii TaxID=86049 RepID=A0A1C1C7H6_9EURO|nr:tat pathway signal sequence [Cladophialophora carrionii]